MAKIKEIDDVQTTIKNTFIVSVWVIFGIVFLFNFIYIVGAGERGVLTTFGSVDMVSKNEGLHFKFPLVQNVHKYNVKTQKYEAQLSSASKDLQDVTTGIAINYRLSAEAAPKMFKEVGVNYQDIIIYPAEQEANKAISARFTAEELITKREVVTEQMKSLLSEKMKDRGVIIEAVSVVNFKFSDSFTQAIEAKVTAEQQALQAKNKLEQIKFEAEQKITTAKAEAESIRIQTEALSKGKDVIDLRWIEKWDGHLPTYMAGNMPLVMMNDK